MYYSKDKHIEHVSTVNIESCLKEKYDSKYKSKTNVHLGQRKLLLSEIQLLNEYYKTNKIDPILIYIGAAIGSHLLILHDLFPKVKFILYDGANFDARLKTYKFMNVFEIHEGNDGFFTSDKCKIEKQRFDKIKRPLLFVSDIRLTEENFEKGVSRDMEMQKEWITILNPFMSLVKFRMPYSLKHGESIDYMKGDILFGIWPKNVSGETRLLIKKENNYNIVKYDFENYEQTMFFHNKYIRPYCFNINYKKYVGVGKHYCPCYDCISELNVINKYVENSQSIKYKSIENVIELIFTLPANKFWSEKQKIQKIQNIDNIISKACKKPV
jgi:hypothetical protein